MKSAHLVLPSNEGFVITDNFGRIDSNHNAEAFTVYFTKERAVRALEADGNKEGNQIHKITFSTLEIL